MWQNFLVVCRKLTVHVFILHKSSPYIDTFIFFVACTFTKIKLDHQHVTWHPSVKKLLSFDLIILHMIKPIHKLLGDDIPFFLENTWLFTGERTTFSLTITPTESDLYLLILLLLVLVLLSSVDLMTYYTDCGFTWDKLHKLLEFMFKNKMDSCIKL
jgi:hypothetical protein